MNEAADLSLQRAALVQAIHLRAEYLIAIAEGYLDPFDVIDAARQPTGVALRGIELEELFLSVEKSTRREWKAIQSRLLATLGVAVKANNLTIGWLIDPRAGGRRYYAMRDAVRPRTGSTWAGFPWRSPTT